MKLANFIPYNPSNTNDQMVYYKDITTTQINVDFNTLGTNQIQIQATPGTKDNPIFTILDLLLAIAIYYDGQDFESKRIEQCTWVNILTKTNEVNNKFGIPNDLLLYDPVNNKEYRTKNNVNILEVINKVKPQTDDGKYLIYYTDTLINKTLTRPKRYLYYSHSLNPFYLNLNWKELFTSLEYPPEVQNDINKMYNDIRSK